jgi:tetratricopeptide (TPR) repeat protein
MNKTTANYNNGKKIFILILSVVLIIFGILIYKNYVSVEDVYIENPRTFSYKEKDGLLANIVNAQQSILFFDYKNTYKFYNNALKKDPKNEALLGEYLFFLVGRGDFNNSVKIAQKIVKYSSKHFLANMVIFVSLIKNGKNLEAENYLARLKDNDGFSLFNFMFAVTSGMNNFKDNDTKKFEESFKDIKIQFEDFYLNNLAANYVIKNNKEKAMISYKYITNNIPSIESTLIYSKLVFDKDKKSGIKTFMEYLDDNFLTEEQAEKYLEKYENKIDSKWLISDAFMRLSKFMSYQSIAPYLAPESFIMVQLALMVNPNNDIAKIETATYYEKIGDFNEAIKQHKTVSNKSFFYRISYQRVFAILEELGKMDLALKEIKDVIGYDTTNPLPLIEKGHVFHKMGKYEEAIKSYSDALNLSEKHNIKLAKWLSLYFRGISYNKQDKWVNAEKDLSEALKLNSSDSLLLNYLGYSYIDRDVDLEKGFELIKKALEKDPENSSILDSYAWGFFKKKQYDKALEIANKAISITPYDAVLTDHLGDIYWQIGKYKQAVYQWRTATNLSPEEDLKSKLINKLKGQLPDYLDKKNVDKIQEVQQMINDGVAIEKEVITEVKEEKKDTNVTNTVRKTNEQKGKTKKLDKKKVKDKNNKVKKEK